ncbi:ExbD/TolR family protein [Thermophagus xiamenensis]|jgi:biopolymer transport protein ExbD|uniref:Biopolymer transport protein ExbD n=1 Tax=Thermophagus xiamenensis TaxID=385682 RepID=A0A1I1W0J0_9BACT|nr:biopolymer transporter ExbD [Thermophagus xiamenensis]SFD88684.1 biopolymer transport protein ExbD [Thermophagus xiamenensis]
MAIKSRSKIDPSFSMSSMTDVVFLLLIFFMITSTLVHPTALKLLLPQSANQTAAKPLTTVSITRDLKYYVEDRRVSFSQIEPLLKEKVGQNPDIYISLHVDENVPMREVVKVMNIAKRNKYKLILATRAK